MRALIFSAVFISAISAMRASVRASVASGVFACAAVKEAMIVCAAICAALIFASAFMMVLLFFPVFVLPVQDWLPASYKSIITHVKLVVNKIIKMERILLSKQTAVNHSLIK
jgi:hypothetical protein